MRILLLLGFLPLFVQAQTCLEYPVHVMGNPARADLANEEHKTIPVVFHVVHTGAAMDNNISDEQVLSQLDVLNESFASPVDTKLDFCLAARDPEGNPTTGITRTNGADLWKNYGTQGISNGQPGSQGVEQEELKAATGCWNPSEYVNIYVVNEINNNDGGNGIQGFAYLGPTGDCRDGIVALYNTVGTVGVQKPGRELGYTVVHEMGHHLSLWHTFSNSTGCTESNCENQGDEVCDTPPTWENSQCTAPSCPDAMVENFMDYTPETCKDSFTEGQAEKMHQLLNAARWELWNSNSCLTPVDFDAMVQDATYQEQWCTPTQDIWVTVSNTGNEPLAFVDVFLFCNGDEYTQQVFDLVNSQDVLFEGVNVYGAQMFEVQVFNALDEYAQNNYLAFPLNYSEGGLLSITVSTDTWANETDWEITQDGEFVIGDGNYPLGQATYVYDLCIYEGCYEVTITDANGDGFCSFDFGSDGVCDLGGEGMTGTVGLDTLFATGFGASFEVWQETFCNTLPQCPMDYDGNGTIGNGDVLIMLSYFGVEDSPVDPNGDGIVNVQDLLHMLSSVGDCPLELDFSVGTYVEVVLEGDLSTRKPTIYDLMGRRVDTPFDMLPTGVYILKYRSVTKKVFVQ